MSAGMACPRTRRIGADRVRSAEVGVSASIAHGCGGCRAVGVRAKMPARKFVGETKEQNIERANSTPRTLRLCATSFMLHAAENAEWTFSVPVHRYDKSGFAPCREAECAHVCRRRRSEFALRHPGLADGFHQPGRADCRHGRLDVQ